MKRSILWPVLATVLVSFVGTTAMAQNNRLAAPYTQPLHKVSGEVQILSLPGFPPGVLQPVEVVTVGGLEMSGAMVDDIKAFNGQQITVYYRETTQMDFGTGHTDPNRLIQPRFVDVNLADSFIPTDLEPALQPVTGVVKVHQEVDHPGKGYTPKVTIENPASGKVYVVKDRYTQRKLAGLDQWGEEDPNTASANGATVTMLGTVAEETGTFHEREVDFEPKSSTFLAKGKLDLLFHIMRANPSAQPLMAAGNGGASASAVASALSAAPATGTISPQIAPPFPGFEWASYGLTIPSGAFFPIYNGSGLQFPPGAGDGDTRWVTMTLEDGVSPNKLRAKAISGEVPQRVPVDPFPIQPTGSNNDGIDADTTGGAQPAVDLKGNPTGGLKRD